MWRSYVGKHLIPRLNGFEILMASYAMAHLKLDMLLHETGCVPDAGSRLRIYLTNSLEEAHAKAVSPFAQWLTSEANEASRIKSDVPVMVVLGNPPYSGESQNGGEWIEKLMSDYKKEPLSGIPLQERNSKWINDDYVKFIRYGQSFIEETGEGILAFINNHSFLDNPTFRGMRWHLLQTFDKIYVLDLHGNSKKKESAPDGGKDENVFDIQQGVSINIFVKTQKRESGMNRLAAVYHADLYGKRADKYDFLLNNSLKTVKWCRLKLTAPQYFFAAKDFSLKKEYDKGFSAREMFPINSVGIVTSKDTVFVNDNKEELLKNIKEHFCIVPDERLIRQISYRPFDNRYVYYDMKILERARENVMRHFLKGDNVGLVISRQAITNNWSHIQVSNAIIDNRIHYSNKGIPLLIPLYLHHECDKHFTDKRKANLNETIINKLSELTGLRFTEEIKETENTFAPIDVLDYIYAALHSPAYREKYREFLKIDFPRVPYPRDAAQFRALAALGAKLRRLHLLEGVEPQPGMADFPIKGGNEIENLQYVGDKVYISKTQYFDGVSPEVWNFYIGGYQPAQKWLKDRKGRKLGYDDILHYQRIIRILKETGELMREVDNQLET
jgi:predicted helicase